MTVDGGFPSGKWVASGPLDPDDLERQIEVEIQRVFDMLKAKVSWGFRV